MNTKYNHFSLSRPGSVAINSNLPNCKIIFCFSIFLFVSMMRFKLNKQVAAKTNSDNIWKMKALSFIEYINIKYLYHEIIFYLQYLHKVISRSAKVMEERETCQISFVFPVALSCVSISYVMPIPVVKSIRFCFNHGTR